MVALTALTLSLNDWTDSFDGRITSLPLNLRTFCDRKLNPLLICVILDFSGESSNPLSIKKPVTKGISSSVMTSLLMAVITNRVDSGGSSPGSTRFGVYTKSKTAARKIGNNLFLFLRNKLKLPINRERADCKEIVQWTILRRSQVDAMEHPPTSQL